MENELGLVYSHIRETCVSAENVDSLASFILENDDKSKYTKEELIFINNIKDDISAMSSRINNEGERILKIQKKIVDDLY